MEYAIVGRIFCDTCPMGSICNKKLSGSERKVGHSGDVSCFTCNGIIYMLYTLDKKMATLALKWAIIYNIFGITAWVSAIMIDWESGLSNILKAVAILYALVTLGRGVVKLIKESYDLKKHIQDIFPTSKKKKENQD